MKKHVLLCFLVLIVGLSLGFAVGSNLPAVLSPQPGEAATPAIQLSNLISPLPDDLPLDQSDNTLLLERGSQVLEALKASDYTALSALVHSEKGVTFTPYSTVDFGCNRVLSAKQIAALAQDNTSYIWGVMDGKGDPIKLTATDYFARFVFNADYTQAPEIGIDTVQSVGNALENVADSYTDARFIEYHLPGLDPKKEGYDWCSLKLVFEVYRNDWYLVGLIHSEWTI